jgi:hypothetical protein
MWGRRFPQLALALRTEIANFEARNVKETDIELEDINDSYHKFRLPGCHVEQIANQSLPMFEDDPWVLINGNLWNLLDAFDKAGLVIHEVLYRIGLKHGLEHSIGIRYLTGLLFQEDLKQVNDQQWIEAMLHSRMKYFELGSLRFPLFQGEEKDCELVPGSIECRGGPAEFKPARLTFGSDRSLSTVVFENGVQQPFEFSFGHIRAILYSSDVVFSRNGDRNFFYAEGRLQMQSNGSMDVSVLDVQGKFEPATGQFTGEYRFMRPDLIVEEKWNHFSGVLSDLHAARRVRLGLAISAASCHCGK